MRTQFFRQILAAFVALCGVMLPGYGQDAGALISAGRSFLATHDAARAAELFQQAVAASPTNHEANALSAISRLIALPQRTAVSNFLDRLGVPKAGRDPYDWTAKFPQTPDGNLVLPVGVQTGEAANLIRGELLGQINLSLQDLYRITNTAFLLPLSKEETTTTHLTVDVADLRLCRALLEGVTVGLHSFYPWELEARLSEIGELLQGGQVTAEEFLHRYPSLYATFQSADATAARAAFLSGVDSYNEAITLIKQRPTNVVRLFNLSESEQDNERQFSRLINELKASIGAPTRLSSDTNLTVNLGAFFSPETSLRGYLPVLRGNGIIAGSWPEPDFGGILIGADLRQVEKSFPLVNEGLAAYFPLDNSVQNVKAPKAVFYTRGVANVNGSAHPFGRWAEFSGRESYAVFENSAFFSGASNWTWSAWVKLPASPYRDGNHLFFSEGTQSSMFWIGYNPVGKGLSVASWNRDVAGNWREAHFPFQPQSVWQQLTLTIENATTQGGLVKLFINGELFGASSTHLTLPPANINLPPTGNQLQVGLGEDIYAFYHQDRWGTFEGGMSDVRIYRRSLSPFEVSRLYSGDLADLDGDGLKDNLELDRYATSPALADSDSDGIADKVEINAGSNPTNAASRPEVIQAFTAVELEFWTNTGATYQLQSSIDLAHWSDYGAAFSGIGGRITRMASTRASVQTYWRLVRR